MDGATDAAAFVYVGSFFGPDDENIRTYRWDSRSGAIELLDRAAGGVENPLYFAADPGERFLYVADCSVAWEEGGAVSAYAIDAATGRLTHLNRQPSGGTIPVHVSVSEDGRWILVANCGPWSPATSRGRTVAVLSVEEDGRLGGRSALCTHRGSGPDPVAQTAPHPHALVLDRANRYAFAPDLGVDRIVTYRFDVSKGTLEPNTPAFVPTEPQSGPRHLRFHPNGRFAYLITEIASTIIAYAYDPAAGRLIELQTVSTVPVDYAGKQTAAELQVHPAGRFLYGSNRGHDSIAVFAIDEESGRLTSAGHVPTGGASPRAFAIDPSGAFALVANEFGDNVVSFRIDPRTGMIEPAGAVTQMPRPACVQFVRVSA